MTYTIDIPGLEELPQAAHKFLELMDDYTVFAFKGEMGAGTTTFINSLPHELGVQTDLTICL